MRRVTATVAATILALGLGAGPAFAHPHDQAHFGQVGPAADSNDAAGAAHEGIQCAFEHGNPHLSGLPLDCPAN